MFRKIFHSIVLGVLALQMGTILCVGTLHAADANPIDSPEMTFSLKDITKTDQKDQWINKGLNYFAERVISIIAGTAGSFAVLMMTYGGFLMIVSAGDDSQITKGKGYIKAAAIGLVAVLGSYLLVVTVQLLINSIYG
jgi:hypothetical protein